LGPGARVKAAGLPRVTFRCYQNAMINDVIIRTAVWSDLDAVTDMWRQLMDLTAIYNRRYRLRPGALDMQRATFGDYLRRTDAYIVVAESESDGRLLAFSNGFMTVPSKTFAQAIIGILENLFVIEDYRRQQIGRRTAEYAIAWLTEKGAHEIYVNVIPRNATSVRFWDKMGFVVQRLAMTRQT